MTPKKTAIFQKKTKKPTFIRLFFKNVFFDLQFLRLIAQTYTQGADIGEAFSTAYRIKDGDAGSWYYHWNELAQQVEKLGREAEQQNNSLSAYQAFLRASNYYRTAFFFLRNNLKDARLLETLKDHQRVFERALEIGKIPVKKLAISFEGLTLPGYLFYGKGYESASLSTVIYPCGMDSTKEEHFFSGIQGLNERGYNVVIFDGPGQNELLFAQHIPFRADYEVVIKAIMDYIEQFAEVKKNAFILLGRSFGSYLTLRAAPDKRIIAAIADPGQYDFFEIFMARVPSFLRNSLNSPYPSRLLRIILSSFERLPFLNFLITSRLIAFGAKNIYELFQIFKTFTLKEIVPHITCPVLVCEAENEPFAPDQAKKLFNALSASPEKAFIYFSAEEGAGEHCELGATALFEQRVFGWLDTIVKKAQ